jgi:Ca2+/Na+ antiporter
MKFLDRSYPRLIGAGVVMFLFGLGIGGTQGQRKTVLNTVSAFLLTLGVLVVVVALILAVVRRTKRVRV